MSDEDAVPLLLSRRAVRLLARGFKLGVLRESSLTGAEPTAEVSALLALLHDAARGRRSSVPGTPTVAPATVDSGSEKVLGMGEAAAVLGCSSEYVRRLARTGRLPAQRVGGVWAVRPEDLDALRYGRSEDTSGQRGYPADSGADRRVATLGADER
ncbi:helix-turn-helix domain-containing protein [Streptomyces althioticus]|uniref:helix-turn-helix domain-containing protein n=1 Tax=Streptomyces althioticus TaxID=83380 RepID=UPI0033FBA24B